MKKLSALLAACLLSLTGMAQKSVLEGTWVQLDANSFPTTNVKVYMPDGKELGLSFNSDYTNSSVWFMSNYHVLNDTSFVDQTFYHSNIYYQRDYFFTYHMVNDSVLVTSYTDYRTNGLGVIMSEQWKKMDRPMLAYTDAEWEALYHKSLAEFDRLPKEGQTVEQFAQEIYDKAQGYVKAKKLDRADELLLMRAELDTTNMKWQKDVLYFYLENKAAPSVSEKIADRIIRLTEAKAPTATDTSVVNAYRNKAYLYNYRGEKGRDQVRKLLSKIIEAETTAGHEPTKAYGLDYFFMAMTYLPQGEFTTIYDYAGKSIDILEKAPDVSKNQLGEAYYLKAMALMGTDRHREAINILQEKVMPLFVDEQGQPLPKVNNEVLPFAHECYVQLLSQNPKDKKLLKEYQEFMSDKLLCAVFEATNKEYNLWGEYNILEVDSWTLEKPSLLSMTSSSRYLMQKGDQFVEVESKEGQKLGCTLRIVPVDAEKKQQVINQWKAYKKNNKK